ncbi:MAG: hypothetical protein J6Y79_03465 [Paludibacteraceae bacterium]|nr:hypothetical protein [Paludibacteraceae bacterium]
MKRTFLTILSIVVSLHTVMAEGSQEPARRSDRKIIELKKIITLSPTQEETIRTAYEAYCLRSDSILYNVSDGLEAAYLTRANKRKYDETLMRTLTENQRNHYIRITCTPEVEEKTASRVAVMRETGDYSQAELDSASRSIFEYLMKEKVVYKRDKYDYRKQRENIGQLKRLKPKHLQCAEAQEKARMYRKYYEGRIRW